MRKPTFARIRAALTALWCVIVPAGGPSFAEDEARLDMLFAELQAAYASWAREIERQILLEWSESGSPAINLLMRRGRAAISLNRYPAAIRRLSALVERAPDSAKGWNARATAHFPMGRYRISMADIGQSLTLDPRHFGAISGMTMILELHGDYVGALSAPQIVEDLHPYRAGSADAI